MSSLDRSLSCKSIPTGAFNAPVVAACDVVSNGALRLQTLFQYPDGSFIDLFLENNSDLTGSLKLSDFGQTATYLSDLQMEPWSSLKKRRISKVICQNLGIARDDEELYVMFEASEIDKVGSYIVRLAQACMRISDLGYARRHRAENSFREDFEEFLMTNNIECRPDVRMPGRFGKIIRVDFQVFGGKGRSLVNTLSTANSSAAHQISNEVFTKWYDLESAAKEYSFVSVYNSENDAFRDDDLKRLESISTVLAFPAQADAIQMALAA